MRATTFTTYFNTAFDGSFDSGWNRMANTATRNLTTVSRAADEAAKAMAGLVKGSGTAGLGAGQTRALRDAAAAEREVGRAAAEAQRAVGGATSALRRESEASAAAARSNSALARSLQTTATALNVVQGPLGPLAGRVSALARAVEELTGFRLGLAGVGASLFVIARAGNQYAVLQSRLLPFFESQQAANKAMSDAIGIAERSRSALEPIVELYSRLTAVSESYGLSQQRIGRLVEIASKTATLSGGTAQTRAAGLNQFAQSIGKGRLNDDELKSITENLPVLAQAIADGFRNADGSIGVAVGKLRELGAEGELTIEKIVEALDRSAAGIEQKFAKLPLTLSQATTQFSNSLTVMVGRFDETIGFTSTLAEAISVVAENLRAVVALAVGLGVAFASPKIVASLKGAGTGIQQLGERTVGAALRVKELDKAWLADLAAAKTAAAARVQELEAERLAIRRTILELQRRQQFAQGVIGQRTTSNQVTWARDPNTGLLYSSVKATKELERSTLKLGDEQTRLSRINRDLRLAYAGAEQASTRLDAATKNVAGRMGFLRSAVGGLVNFFGGPWGIALGVATTALYLLATAESAAERATRLHEEAQREFEKVIDKTTGKIYAQATALEVLAAKKATSEKQSGLLDQFAATRSDIAQRLRLFSRNEMRGEFGEVVSSRPGNRAQQQLDAAIDHFMATGRAKELQQAIGKLAPSIRGLGDVVTSLNEQVNGYNDLARKVSQGGAMRRLLAAGGDTNRISDRDLRLINEDEPHRTTARARSAAELNAEAQAKAARTALEQAKAQLAETRAKGPQAGESESAYTDRLAGEIQRVRDLTKAEADARKARAAGRAQERREARDARQDALDEAAAKRDAALVSLLGEGLPADSEAFLNRRREILRTYDQEVNAIDASRAASHSATQQQIADAERLQKAAAANTEKRSDILGQWTDHPKAVTRAMDQIDDLEKVVGKFIEIDGKLVEYTEAMFDRDVRTIREGIQRPLQEVLRDHERQLEVQRLILQGRDAEAEALRAAYVLHDQIGDISQKEYEALVRNADQQQRINDLLASRERIVSAVMGSVDQAREATEQFLMDVSELDPSADANLLKSIQRSITRIQVRSITEQIFAGADRVAAASDRMAGGLAGSPARVGDMPANIVKSLANAGELKLASGAMLAGAADKIAQATITKLGSVAADDIVVSGAAGRAGSPLAIGGIPSAANVSRTLFESIFGSGDRFIDWLSGKRRRAADGALINADGSLATGSSFFKKMGDVFGTALHGAGLGSLSSGFASMAGIRQDGTGAALGGAIGSLIPGLGPLGSLAGGVIGGLLGSLINGIQKGSVTIGGTAGGLGIVGSMGKSGIIGNATTAGDSLIATVNRIAEQLGGTVNAGLGRVSIGQRNGSWRVDPTGSGQTKASFVKDFGEDSEAAIRFAIMDLIQDGVISGISQASQNILRAGKDLEQAIEKAAAIESIPKRLMAIEDPVRYALEELNAEFTKLIGYLNEGGASAQQYADAQKLYEHERARAIEAATEQARGAIDAFLKDMAGGQQSPLSKRTVYQNAEAELNRFKADIAAGKLVDQNDLLTAARNFQDASRALYGSSQSFFADFEALRELLTKARDNAGISNVSTLPASPFATDKTVTDMLASLSTSTVAATNSQTSAIVAKLDQLIDAIATVPITGTGHYGDRAMDLLPNFRRPAA